MKSDEDRPLLALYFVRDGYLVPQFEQLPGDGSPREIFALLEKGPGGRLLETAVPAGSEVLQEAEPGEGELVLDLDDRFWTGTPAEIRTRVAQVVFTMAGLEEGRGITLLQGSTPARIPDARGRRIPQPLSATDFPGPRPLLQVVQPVPGATVPSDVPVHVLVPRAARVWGIVSENESLGPKTRLRSGSGVLKTDISGTKDVKIVIVVLRGADRASVSIPVTVSG